MANTLVVVADSAGARVFDYIRGESFSKSHEFSHFESRQKGSELSSDRAGQQKGHGSMVSSSNPKEFEAQRFAKELADWLDNARRINRCGRILLVADPHFLGLLRKSMNNHTAGLISETIDKNFSQINDKELPERLGLLTH